MTRPALIILAGLPGTGKTTVSHLLAKALPAVHLRIDTIETALRQTGVMPDDMRDLGYRVAHGIAQDNLRLGHHVIADCVNAFAVTRRDWRKVAERADARILSVELSCSDSIGHRHRIETRLPDIPGARLPDWQDVQSRDYQPWNEADLRLDSAKLTPEEAAARITARLGRT